MDCFVRNVLSSKIYFRNANKKVKTDLKVKISNDLK